MKIKLRLSPAQIFVSGFLATILIGTFLLSLPVSRTHPIAFIDLLFTSTSATCVTGLSTINIGSDLTPVGQLIVLALIQIGGIGIMAYAALFSLILVRHVHTRTSSSLANIMDIYDAQRFRSILVSIFRYTLLIEVVGTAWLFFSNPFAAYPIKDRLFYSVFHSISAFCNAGFSLFTNSFESVTSVFFISGIIFLIILGGLGFWVLLDFHNFNVLAPLRSYRRLSLHTKIVLYTTAILLVAGAVLFFVTENTKLFQEMSLNRKILHSIFLSVTARTAGFNIIPTGLLANPSIFLLMILMFIGASPGSTGGGLKTSTFGILILKLRQILTTKKDVEAFGRRIPDDIVVKALAILFLSLSLLSIATFLIFLTDNHEFSAIIFEVVSAFGTVGLSTGITPELSTATKYLVSFVMLTGRVGPLTLALSLAISKNIVKYTLPEEKVLVG